MSNEQQEHIAIEAAIDAGLAPADIALVAGIPMSDRYSPRAAVASNYQVRWFNVGQLSGPADNPKDRWNGSGWHISSLLPGGKDSSVPQSVRDAVAGLIAAFPPKDSQ